MCVRGTVVLAARHRVAMAGWEGSCRHPSVAANHHAVGEEGVNAEPNHCVPSRLALQPLICSRPTTGLGSGRRGRPGSWAVLCTADQYAALSDGLAKHTCQGEYTVFGYKQRAGFCVYDADQAAGRPLASMSLGRQRWRRRGTPAACSDRLAPGSACRPPCCVPAGAAAPSCPRRPAMPARGH